MLEAIALESTFQSIHQMVYIFEFWNVFRQERIDSDGLGINNITHTYESVSIEKNNGAIP